MQCCCKFKTRLEACHISAATSVYFRNRKWDTYHDETYRAGNEVRETG